MPHAAEAEIVREILELSRQGQKTRDILSVLNAKGAKRRNGTPWTMRQVRAVRSRRHLYEQGIIHYGVVHGLNEKLILVKVDKT